MKCIHCGFESEGYAFCPHCGRALPQAPEAQPAAEAPVEPTENAGLAAAHILQVLKDPLFLVVCILLSVTCVLQISVGGLPILQILAVIFLWLTYAKSRSDVPDREQLRNLSGTAYANYVIMNVASILTAVGGIMFLVSAGIVEALAEPGYDLLTELELDLDLGALFPVSNMDPGKLAASIFTGMGIIFIVVAVVMFILNLKGMRPIHRFAKSLYQSLDADQLQFENCGKAGTWLMVFGIFCGISAVSSLSDLYYTAFLADGTQAAALIIASVLVKRYFSRWAG